MKQSTGVPQGSVLGPLLFLIYINDLPENLTKGKATLYADDTNVLLKSTNSEIQQNIDITLSQLTDWFNINKLNLNAEKTNCIHFHPHQLNIKCPPIVNIMNTEIEFSTSTKFLGIIVDDELKWDEHASHLANKLSSIIFQMRILSPILDRLSLVSIYHALFHY